MFADSPAFISAQVSSANNSVVSIAEPCHGFIWMKTLSWQITSSQTLGNELITGKRTMAKNHNEKYISPDS